MFVAYGSIYAIRSAGTATRCYGLQATSQDLENSEFAPVRCPRRQVMTTESLSRRRPQSARERRHQALRRYAEAASAGVTRNRGLHLYNGLIKSNGCDVKAQKTKTGAAAPALLTFQTIGLDQSESQFLRIAAAAFRDQRIH